MRLLWLVVSRLKSQRGQRLCHLGSIKYMSTNLCTISSVLLLLLPTISLRRSIPLLLTIATLHPTSTHHPNRLGILFPHSRQEILCILFGLGDHRIVWSSNVHMHGLITLPTRVSLEKATALTFDLDTGLRLCLDMLHKGTSRPNDLCSSVKVANRSQVDKDLFFFPLSPHTRRWTHLFPFPPALASILYQCTKLGIDELANLDDTLVEDLLRGRLDV